MRRQRMHLASGVIEQESLHVFFRAELAAARESLGVTVPELLEYYLVQLLTDFGFVGGGQVVPAEPLTLLYQRALETPTPERAQRLKELGDQALYVAGFFGERVARSSVDVGYYARVGGSAYAAVPGALGSRAQADVLGNVYLELAQRFLDLVRVLGEVATRALCRRAADGELLRLYERWQRTRDRRLERVLTERGLLPAPRGGGGRCCP